MNRITEAVKENKTKTDARKEAKEARRGGKRNYRIEKIKALTAKAYAVATKRKWLVFLLGLVIIAYLVFTSGGGFGGFGGILEKIKGFF